MQAPKKRHPNASCVICGRGFYAQPSIHRETCSMECRTENYRRRGLLLTGAKPGPANSRWAGGRWRQGQGYVLVLAPEHPHADRHGYVREHRLVMERVLGRYLTPGEVVHHRNHVRDDNRPENLELFASNGEHKHTEHLRGRQLQAPD
jgi:hypothetical protein